MNKNLKIVFMGTPDFAAVSLNALKKAGYEIPLVVTQPDRKKGRGKKLHPSAVKVAALEHNCNLIQPDSVNTDEFYNTIKEIKPDIFVVVAFGQILKKKLLDLPEFFPINIHASILPKYRGAAPIQRAIINREKETGVTTMIMNTKLDAGDILLLQKEPILPDDTSETLHNRLATLGADLLIKTLKSVENNTISPVPQNHTLASTAPMLKKADGLINWNLPAHHIDALIRGVTPWPGAFTHAGGKRLKIFKVTGAAKTAKNADPGTLLPGFSNELRVATKTTPLSIVEIQGASSKRMPVDKFLMGNKLPPNTILK